MLEGVRVRDLQRLAPDVLAGVLPRVYPQMLEIAYRHQDAGRPVYICTAASQEMAELMATVLTFDGAVGSRRGDRRRALHGPRPAARSPTARARPQAMRELAEREGIDLAESWAYSDSESDLPMLRAVGHPVAVNPDKELARIARAEGWEILRFERLGRRLRVAGAAALAAGLGGAARSSSRRRRRARRLAAAPGMSLHELEPEQREIRDLARRFADERIAPHAARVGPRAHVPARAVRASSASSA